jgi:methionyl-tRNA formyltransferase
MRIIIFGCRKITSDVIKHVIDSGHEIPLVVTHDEERDRIYGSPLVSEYCDLNDIDNIRFDKKIDTQLIYDKKPDLLFSVYYRKILRQSVLDIPRLGCINIHPAILPKGRGPAPTMWNVLNGDEFAGSTIHYMVKDVDAGDIIDQKIIRVNNRTGFDLNRDLMNVCYELFVNNFNLICGEKNNRVPQSHSDAEYCLPFKTSLRYVSWGDPDSVINAVRAFTKPYDGAISYTDKKERILIWECIKLNSRESLKPPGCFEITDDGIVVQTNTLPVLITKYDIISEALRKNGRFVSGPPVMEGI